MLMYYNVYCDESCHLEHDGINVMVLGAVWCPHDMVREVKNRIRKIKPRNGLPETSEMKWTRLSPAKFNFVNIILTIGV